MTDDSWVQPEAHIDPDVAEVIKAADQHEPHGWTFMERFDPELIRELYKRAV